MKFLDRVVVAGDRLQLPVAADLHVVLARVADEVLERAMGVLPEHLVVQVHAQAAGGVAEDPDLGVLALRPFGMRAVLRFQPLGDAVHVPVERLVVVAGDLERPGPLVVAGDVLVRGQQQEEPRAKEQVAVGADRIRLQPPRLDAVGGPAEAVVLAAQVRRNLPHDRRRIVRALRVVADLREPVDRAPVGRDSGWPVRRRSACRPLATPASDPPSAAGRRPSTRGRSGRSSGPPGRCTCPTRDAECPLRSSRLSSSLSPTGIEASRHHAASAPGTARRCAATTGQPARRLRSGDLRLRRNRQRRRTGGGGDRFHEASTRQFVQFSHCLLQLSWSVTRPTASRPWGSKNFQVFDDRPDLVPGELALESRHVVDLRAQLDGVAIPHLVEQHALRVDVARIRRSGRLRDRSRAVALAFRAVALRAVRGEEGLAFRDHVGLDASGLFSALRSVVMSQP